ncbi:hypothetical protein F1C16_07995 [Hymenobacter sp. NBH84]|uniref:hypothetical protein n=1 Tax=Hymenobacter sp. NBH84 TaxID=2596915 RepID=UPI00162337B5|nr:hypothetical protein [Hymenobacter sp. NBH84]QNE39497.1 hypothetical protein F1C16_07995 [Hymenobacter sp. NBH84]
MNTTFTVDVTGAKVGRVVRIKLGVSATEPAIPGAGFTKLTSAVFTAGEGHVYSFCVAADSTIDYYITVLG